MQTLTADSAQSWSPRGMATWGLESGLVVCGSPKLGGGERGYVGVKWAFPEEEDDFQAEHLSKAFHTCFVFQGDFSLLVTFPGFLQKGQ